MAERFTLIKHDPDRRNWVYLYGHSTVVATVYSDDHDSKHSVDIVRTQANDEEEADYLADYQIRRFASGLEQRSIELHLNIVQAYDMARRIANYNASVAQYHA